MDGTLETKKTMDWLAQDLVKPEWMLNTSPDLWTEDQNEQVAEFDLKVTELMEGRAAQKKVLETELKKLRVEIQEALTSFDNRLKVVFNQRVMVMKHIFK